MSFEEVQIGPCRLIRGDCREVLPTLEAGSVDAVVTDPPYGKKPCRSIKSSFGSKNSRSFDSGSDYWDTKPPCDIINQIVSIRSVIWGGQYFGLPPSNCWLVWDKMNGKNPFADCEMAWSNLTTNNKLLRYQWIGAHARRIEPAFHPTQKPVAVMKWCLSYVNANTIADPFMGSGSTGIACLSSNRNFIGIEISAEYFDIACRRIERAWQEKKSELPLEVV